jgi:hypothetical protein
MSLKWSLEDYEDNGLNPMTWGKQDNYYNSLKRREQSTHGNNVPLTDKEKNDLKLLEITKHYEKILKEKQNR